MSSVISVLAASVTTFAATNLDDIFLLTVFFARRVPTRRIVAGHYLGFATIVALSFALVWGVSLAIPRVWTRLLGILPLAIGIKELVRIRTSQAIPAERVDSSVSVLSIATITLANGADNVGVYVPFFVAHQNGPAVGLGCLWAVAPRMVCRREVVWASCPRLESTRRLGSLDCAVCVNRTRRLHSPLGLTGEPFLVHPNACIKVLLPGGAGRLPPPG